MSVPDPLVAGLASAYFLATFLFAGYVLKMYVELVTTLEEIEGRLDQFKYLEDQLDAMMAEVFRDLVEEVA